MVSQAAEYVFERFSSWPDGTASPLSCWKSRDGPGFQPATYPRCFKGSVALESCGHSGGFCLVRQPDRLAVLEVVEVLAAQQRIHRCPVGGGPHWQDLCSLQRRLDRAMAMVENAFAAPAFAELLNEPGQRAPLCQENNVEYAAECES